MSAELHAVDGAGRFAPAEVEQHPDDTEAGLSRELDRDIHIWKERFVDSERKPVWIEPYTRAAVAEHEPAKSGYPARRERIEMSANPIEIGPMPQTASWMPGIGSEVTAILNPRKVCAEDERRELERHRSYCFDIRLRGKSLRYARAIAWIMRKAAIGRLWSWLRSST